MKSALTALLAIVSLSTSAMADQTITYPVKDPVFSISFPDAWKVEPKGSELSASSEDELVNMSLSAIEAESAEGAVEGAKEGLSEELEGIKWAGEPESGEVNGMKATFLNGRVAIEGVNMAVNCAVFEPKGADTFFMLFNMIPVEALDKHGEDVSKVLNSIKGK